MQPHSDLYGLQPIELDTVQQSQWQPPQENRGQQW